MLIHDFVHVDAPFADVCANLLDGSHGWLADAAGAACDDVERLFPTVSATPAEVVVAPRVQLDLGAAYPRGDGLVVPLSWLAGGGRRLFPVLEGDLEVMPLGPHRVMLTLMGRYESPPSPSGAGIDRLRMHRIAETCVRDFLDRTARRLDHAIVTVAATPA